MAEQTEKPNLDLEIKLSQGQKTGFMQRWLRRKNDAQLITKENANKDPSLKLENTTEIDAEPVSISSSDPEEYKTDEDMLPLDQLTEESDFSDFLSPRVTEALRKQALRKLFHMPFLNVVDGLDDYAEDYTSFATLGDLIPEEMKRMHEREKAKELAKEKELASIEQEELAADKIDNDLNDDLDAEIETEQHEYEINNNQLSENDDDHNLDARHESESLPLFQDNDSTNQ